MFWPRVWFEEELRMHDNLWTPINNGNDRVIGFGPRSWWVARRGDSYVGIYCNRTTEWETTVIEDYSTMQVFIILILFMIMLNHSPYFI
jgi:hypothetical protein